MSHKKTLRELTLNLQDGSRTIFLSTRGKNKNEVSEALVKFLDFVRADLEESTKDFEDEFVRMLQNSVQQIKKSRAMEERFMTLHEMLQDERAEGKAEGKAESVIELLEELGTVSAELSEKIMNETDLSVLQKWLKLAAKSDTVEYFLQNM